MSRIRVSSVHELAQCHDCDWYSEDRNAVKRGGDHHRKTGHKVSGERGTYFEYERDAALSTERSA